MAHIDSIAIGKIRVALWAGRTEPVISGLSGATISLSSALEISTLLAKDSNVDVKIREILSSIKHPAIDSCSSLLAGGDGGCLELKRRGFAELRAVSELNSDDKPWAEYLMRFWETLKSSGYDNDYARALAYSLHEMADNVRQHSGLALGGICKAVSGWHVAEGIAAFAVIDLGRGIRSSLAENPTWASLETDSDALRAVITEHATRIPQNHFGDGFSKVVHSFVSRNGCLCLRSGNAELEAVGDILSQNIRTSVCPTFSGTRVSAWCDPRQSVLPREPEI